MYLWKFGELLSVLAHQLCGFQPSFRGHMIYIEHNYQAVTETTLNYPGVAVPFMASGWSQVPALDCLGTEMLLSNGSNVTQGSSTGFSVLPA